MMTLLNTPVSFIATAKSIESRNFYEKVLHLKCLSDEPFALVFDLGSTTLRVQKVESVTEVSYTVFGWEVLNIRECVDRLSRKGVQFENFPRLPQDESGIWTAPDGALVAWFKDPDGNTLSLTER